jgi:hypothetical protein
VQFFEECPPKSLEYVSIPVLECLERAGIEAETGELPPERLALLRTALAGVKRMSEEELLAFIREHDRDPETCRLPPPYTYRFLRELDGDYAVKCHGYVDKLNRGEIAEAEFAAELAEFLPPVSRENLEKAVRGILLKEAGDAEVPLTLLEEFGSGD